MLLLDFECDKMCDCHSYSVHVKEVNKAQAWGVNGIPQKKKNKNAHTQNYHNINIVHEKKNQSKKKEWKMSEKKTKNCVAFRHQKLCYILLLFFFNSFVMD